MDEHKEKEEENKFQESPEQLQAPRKQEAEDSSEESIGPQQHNQSGVYKEGMRNAAEDDDEEEETVVVQLKEVVETGSAPWVLGVFANPCSLLQYLRPLVLRPARRFRRRRPKATTANYFCMQGVLAVRRRGRPSPGGPDRPREGRGGNGGVHN